MPFPDVVAGIDAIYTPRRDFDFAGKSEKVPALDVAFAANRDGQEIDPAPG